MSIDQGFLLKNYGWMDTKVSPKRAAKQWVPIFLEWQSLSVLDSTP